MMNMVQRATKVVWIAEDGKEFETEAEADKYERIKGITNILISASSFHSYVSDIAPFLFKNREKLIPFLLDPVKEAPKHDFQQPSRCRFGTDTETGGVSPEQL